MSSRIFIIVVNWNGFEVTKDCLDSLSRLDYSNYEIIIVDNGSSDDSCKLLRLKYPNIQILENKNNLGFAAACNAGLRYAADRQAEYCFLLNNDATVTPTILTEFVLTAERYPEAGIFGAKIYYQHDPLRIWRVRPVWQEKKFSFDNVGTDEIDDKGLFDQTAEIDYANGCALFMRMEVVKRIGLMDEKFFMYYEEIDWCFRAREVGYKILFVPKAKVWHRVGYSSGGEASVMGAYFSARNECRWVQRSPRINKIKFYQHKLLRLVKLLVKKEAGGGRNNFSIPVRVAMLMGVSDFFLGCSGDCPWYIKRWNEYDQKIRRHKS